MHAAARMVALALLAAAGPAAAAPALIVVNQGDASVSVLDPETLTVVGRIAEGLEGRIHVHEAAVAADGRTAVLPVYGDTGVGRPGVDGRQILFADLKTRRVTGTLDLGRGLRPHLAVRDPRSGLVYVTTELDDAVAVVDPARRAVVGRVPTGAAQSHMLALSHDGRFGYTANVAPGSVSVLDLAGRRTLAVIPVAGSVQRIAVSADDALVFTADADAPRLAVIDAAARRVRAYVPLPARGYGSAATPDGRRLLIALPDADAVGVVDLATMAVERTVPVGKAPQAVLIRPDGKVAYVSCAGAGSVVAIDLETLTVAGTAATGPGADGLAWAGS